MKIINEKGKLFGIINIIDLIVILAIVLLVGGGVKRAKTNKPEIITETKKALIEFEISDIRTPSVEALEVGDMLYTSDKGEEFGKVVHKKIEPSKELVETRDGKLVFAEVPEKYDVTLMIEVQAKDTPDSVVVVGEQVRIGQQFKFKNKKIVINGIVLRVDFE